MQGTASPIYRLAAVAAALDVIEPRQEGPRCGDAVRNLMRRNTPDALFRRAGRGPWFTDRERLRLAYGDEIGERLADVLDEMARPAPTRSERLDDFEPDDGGEDEHRDDFTANYHGSQFLAAALTKQERRILRAIAPPGAWVGADGTAARFVAELAMCEANRRWAERARGAKPRPHRRVSDQIRSRAIGGGPELRPGTKGRACESGDEPTPSRLAS